MSKNALLLFSLVNMTLLTIDITPSKIFIFVIVVILVLKAYKKVFNYRKIDKFKVPLLSSNQAEYVTIQLFVALMSLVFQHQSFQKSLNSTIICVIFLLLALLLTSDTLIVIIFNLCFLLQLMQSLNAQNRNKIRKKLGIIRAQSILITEEQLNKYLSVPQVRYVINKMH